MELLKNIFGITVQFESWDKQSALPLYIIGNYEIQAALLNGCRCILLTPKEEPATLPALKKHIKKIQELEDVPVIFQLPSITSYRRKNLIEGRIPFVTSKQAFLPFMGTYLTKENEESVKIKKLYFSTQQLVLLYLYSNEKKLHVSKATKELPFTAMTMSRAVKQLAQLGLFSIQKERAGTVLESRYDRRQLFDKIKGHLSSPVRKVKYMEKTSLTTDMAIAGETALAEETMLNPNRVETYAVYVKAIDEKLLINELVDPDKQVRVELWEYAPKQFSDNYTADQLSIALSFMECEDERVQEAVEELVESVWRK